MPFEHQPPKSPEPRALTLPVIRPIPARTLVAGLSVIILFAALFSYLVEVPSREYVSGRLEPVGGEILLRAVQEGTVATLAPPGTDIDAGGLVATVVDVARHSEKAASGPTMTATSAKYPQQQQLLAPVNATVLSNAVTAGSTVMTGQLLSVLALRNAPMQAVLQVPSRALAQLQPGKIVQLRLSAFPYETFGQVQAVIESVELSPSSEVGSRPAASPGQDNYYKAIAKILSAPPQTSDGTTTVLRSGMPLEASVEVERRTLLAWVVWPLLKQFD